MQPPPYTEDITYSLYRAPVAEITSVEGLTPLATGIEPTLVVDPTPSPTDHCYVVTAVDAVGNESPPSNSFYLNFELLPVSSLLVVQAGDDPPVVSWTHPGGSIAGYDIYLGAGDGQVKLNAELLTATSFVDSGYAGDRRQYTVIAVDVNAAQSLGRSILLPMVSAELQPPGAVKRGIMNQLDYLVENPGSGSLDNVRLRVDVASHAHVSEAFSLDPGISKTIPVVVGGYEDLPDAAPLTTTIEITPAAGERVEIVRNSDIAVADGSLVLQIQNETFTRGASGSVQFTIQNTGEAEIEIVTARNAGNAASNQVIFYLLDEDGNVLAVQPFKQGVGDKIVTLANKNSVARIGAGETFTSAPINMAVPANAPDNVVVMLDIGDIYYHQGKPDQVRMDGLSTTHAVTLIDTAYFGEVLDITPRSSTGAEDIVISGQAVERSTWAPLPGVPLNLVITVNGFERSYEVFTDADGTFAHTFAPLAGEAGVYTVRAVHPDLTDKPVHGQFVINRVTVAPAAFNLNIPKNYEKTVSVRVSTGDGTAVSNLRLVYDAADQPLGEFPVGVHLEPGGPVARLGAKKIVWLPFKLWADNSVDATGKLVLKVQSDESAPEAWATVVVNTRFSEAVPVLYFSPNHVETGVALNDSVVETVKLENRGLAEMHDVSVSLKDQNGNSAPAWVMLNSSADLGDMPVGDARQVSIAFSPTADVAEGDYAFKLRVSASNHATTDVNLYAAVTRDGIGNVLFKVSDIYTGTLNANDQVIQGLAGANVKVQNEMVLTEEYTLGTDAYGEAYFSELPAGRYKVRITAANHQEYIGRIWIKPGITINEDVFLDYNLVTVEWRVNEITIEDKYEIVLAATYETDVPAAVVVIEPASVTLPRMKAGDVFNGEFTLTNYGLIRADDLRITLPGDDQYFAYEFLVGIPDSLEAKQRLTVPYRITSLKSLDPAEDGEASGGGCSTYSTCASVNYGYKCANGQETKAANYHCWTYTYGTCSIGGYTPTVGGGGTWNVGGGTGGGSISNPAPAPKPIQGVKCFPKPPRKECYSGTCDLQKDTRAEIVQPTGSSVNTVMREYNRENIDLSVKVPGGAMEVRRRFYENKWHWEHIRNNLKFNQDSLGSGLESIDKGGVIYEASATQSNVFIHDTYRIVKIDTGYRWEDKRGSWKDYDADGRMTAYGTRTGVVGRLLYDTGENSRLIGVVDRDDIQRLWFEYDGAGQISAVYDQVGRRVQYSYNNNQLETVTDVLSQDTVYEYDSKNRLNKVVDALGRVMTISYDSYGNVASVLDSEGEGYFFEYDFDEAKSELYVRIKTSAGKIKEIWYDRDDEVKRVDVNGRTVKKITKDGRNLLITDERDNVTRKEFDEWDNLTKVVHPDGSIVSYEYEHTFNKRIKATDENGVITQFEYDDAGNVVQKTEAAGTDMERVTEYTYDEDGNLLTTKRLGDAVTAESLTVLEYDDVGNMIALTDPEGNVTRFTIHDIMGNVLTKEDARGKIWTYDYDVSGQLEKVTDPMGFITQMFYDALGNKVKEIDAEGNEKRFEYDESDNVIKITDALGSQTLFEYNADSKLIKQTDPEGKIIRYEYDLDGRLAKTIDGNGNEIAMEYDATGSGCSSCSGGGSTNQPSMIIYPTFEKEYAYDKRGRKTVEKDVLSDTEIYYTDFEYDSASNLTARTDKEGQLTQYAYDELNRLKTVTDVLNQETQYKYDNRDNLIELTDANGNTTKFEFDKNNRLLKEIRPMGQATFYFYDEAGNLAVKIDAKNQKTTYDYDDIGRLVEIKYYDVSDHTTAAKTVSFTYDSVGNLKTYDDGVTSGQYGYDALYRKVSETVDYGSFQLSNSYEYYKNGLKKSFTGPDNITYEYSYDPNNQLTAVQIPGTGSITYNSYTWNRPDAVTLPGGSRREYTYDPLMRVKSIQMKDPGQNLLLNYQYQYDKMDNIRTKATEHGNYDYGYDELYRLVNADNPVQADEGFTYDAVGNRLTEAGVADDWSYNDNNELQRYDSVTFEYDVNGNMTQKTDNGQVGKFFYNLEDRLERVENGSGSLIGSYYYDPFGRRLWKETGGTRTYFVYSDEGLIGEVDINGNVVKTYGYKPGSTWTTDPLFMKSGGQYYFYQNDHLGTPQKLTAVNGAVIWSAMYTSFGEVEEDASSSITNNLRFPGQYFDQEMGLLYNYHRYYNPKFGRYIAVDPINFKGGSINLYIYTLNNPGIYLDPIGLSVLAKCTYISGGFAAGAGNLECDLIGECINGYRQVASYVGTVFGLTIGSPLGGTYFTIYNEHDNDVRVFEGDLKINMISMAFGIGISSGEICFNNRCHYPEMSPQFGLDFSIDLMEGSGEVIDIRKECCQ